MRFLLLCLVVCSDAWGADLLLFGGRGHSTFLGCLNCSKHDSASVCNTYGEHGSKFQSDSIWATYGDFGSRYSATSPWNRYASYPPVIVDREGGFYGYLTDSYAEPKRTTDASLIELIERAREDLGEASDWFCERGDYE